MSAQLLWLDDRARPGAQNMRRDRALLAAAEIGALRSPILRVYGWSPPAVSLGYHQSEDWIDLARMSSLGLDLVRRPTGGAAVLHDEEITYAIAAPVDLCGVRARVGEIYELITRALVQALASLGIQGTRGGDGRPSGAACFSALGGHEIAVDGRKLVGSALRLGRRAFLQHGSILAGPGHLRLSELQRSSEGPGMEAGSAAALAERTTDLRALGREDIDRQSLGAALARALGSRLRMRIRQIDALPVCVLRRLEDIERVGQPTEARSWR